MRTYALALLVGKHSSDEISTFVVPMFVGMCALVAALVYFSLRAQRKRREALAQFAMENGFIYSAKPDPGVAAELAQIHTAAIGDDINPRLDNVLQGSAAGCELIIVDRTLGSGKSASTATICAYKFGAPFPNFMLCPENVLWRVADKLGYRDIDVE